MRTRVSKIGFVALVYLGLAWVCLRPSLTLGQVSPVWPAAGFALAVTMRWGYGMLAGIWLGAFVANDIVGPVGPALAIATGSAVQAGIGACLVHRFVGRDPPLDTDTSVWRFFMAGALAPATIGATVGAAALVLGTRATDGMYLWATWWVGDVVGVLTVAPLVLSLLGRHAPWPERRRIVGFSGIGALGLIVVLYAPVDPWDYGRIAILISSVVLCGMVSGFTLVSTGRAWRLAELADTQARTMIELERSNDALDVFAASAAHDLKSPLRGIALLADWIEDDLGADLPADARGHLDLMRGRINRLDALLDGLLAYARVGQVTHDPRPVPLEALVREVMALSPQPQFPVAIIGGALAPEIAKAPLQQVILDLLGNAIRHHDRDAGQVEIRAERRPGALVLTVTDDGPGIPPDMQDRVWQMFTTLRPRDELEGSGLGLSLVRRIVRNAGGEAVLTSPVDDGRGVAVEVTWPVARWA